MKRHSVLFIACTLLLALIVSACGGLAGEPEIIGQLPASTLSAPPVAPDNAPDLALGALIYAENCVRCHGETGAGDGEFVLSGQITGIPNFADPAQHEGRTAEEYFVAVTNGNLQALMPPFSGSLGEQERWSVANYVMTLAGDDISVAVAESTADITAPEPITTEEATLADDATENSGTASTDTENSDTTTTAPGTISGTVSGTVIQGTIGSSIPETGTVTLSIIEMTGAQTTLTTGLAPDGTYVFDNLPIIDNAGYFVSMEYGDGTFNSEFASLTTDSPEINLNITIYETTDDDSVILIEVVLSQINVLDENTLQVWQLVSVVNTSDRLYVYTDDRGQSVSVEVPAPAGVQLSPNIDLSRFTFNNNAVYDTRPVVPGTEHSFHLLYTIPINGSVEFTQSFPYAFIGPYEAYVDSSQLRLRGDGWQTLETPQELDGIAYRGIAKVNGFIADETIRFTIQQTGFNIDRRWIGYGIIGIGLVLIVVAGFFYLRAPSTSAPSGTETSQNEESVQDLMKQIADLDNRFENGEIDKAYYDTRRQSLKDKVTRLMKSEKA